MSRLYLRNLYEAMYNVFAFLHTNMFRNPQLIEQSIYKVACQRYVFKHARMQAGTVVKCHDYMLCLTMNQPHIGGHEFMDQRITLNTWFGISQLYVDLYR